MLIKDPLKTIIAYRSLATMQLTYIHIYSKIPTIIIVKSSDAAPDSHPLWYARVIGIFHTNVQHIGKDSRDYRIQRMEFLWVRWLDVVPDHPFGRQQAHLPKIKPVPDSDESAFGFIDPAVVLRGCHLLPAFKDGRTNKLVTTIPQAITEAQTSGAEDDWINYYVGMSAAVSFSFMIHKFTFAAADLLIATCSFVSWGVGSATKVKSTALHLMEWAMRVFRRRMT